MDNSSFAISSTQSFEGEIGSERRAVLDARRRPNRNRGLFFGLKRCFDLVFSLSLLPFLVLSALILLVLNPFLNPGPLLYVQPRMGRNCRAFPAFKFRTMAPVKKISRQAEDPIEHDRISGFGRFLRKTRIDELPQVFNVLRGEMSLIGPRPEYFPHARRYVRRIPDYRMRYSVRPGISGLAQVEIGYTSNIAETKAKVSRDLYYIENAGFRLDCYIFYRTLVTVIGRHGA